MFRSILPHPERCCICRSNTKQYLQGIPNRTIVQEEALQLINSRLGIHFIELYNRQMNEWYEYYMCNNFHNTGYLHGSMGRNEIMVENSCITYERVQYCLRSIRDSMNFIKRFTSRLSDLLF